MIYLDVDLLYLESVSSTNRATTATFNATAKKAKVNLSLRHCKFEKLKILFILFPNVVASH